MGLATQNRNVRPFAGRATGGRRTMRFPKLGNFRRIYKALPDAFAEILENMPDSPASSAPGSPVSVASPVLATGRRSPKLGNINIDLTKLNGESVLATLKELRRDSTPDSPAEPMSVEAVRRSLMAPIRTGRPAFSGGAYSRSPVPSAGSVPDLVFAASDDDTPQKEDDTPMKDEDTTQLTILQVDTLATSLTHESQKEPLLTPLLPGSSPDYDMDTPELAPQFAATIIRDGSGKMHAVYKQHMEMFARMRTGELAAKPKLSRAAEVFALPWDTNGNYIDDVAGSTDSYLSPLSRSVIEPFYSVDKETQLKILKATLDATYHEDEVYRRAVAQSNRPIHIMVDMSNIIIGFYNTLKQRRFIHPATRVPPPPFFFEAFATALERARPIAKRVLAGSRSETRTSGPPAYLLEAERLGYEMCILQRVSGTKRAARFGLAASSWEERTSGQTMMPWSEYDPGLHGYREQGVDEVLHLKMCQSVLEAEPATLVIATGDAAEAEFSDGFYQNVVRALEKGWIVEVVGWRDNMAAAWFDDAFQKRWGAKLRTFCLDEVAEELLGGHHLRSQQPRA